MRGLSVLVLAGLLGLGGCNTATEQSTPPFRQESSEGIVSIDPGRPTRITLKRSTKGKYSWELKGEDLEDMIRIDTRLREYTRQKQNQYK